MTFVIMVNKQTGFLSVVLKGSKKYNKMRGHCKKYKESTNKKILDKEVLETNKLLL